MTVEAHKLPIQLCLNCGRKSECCSTTEQNWQKAPVEGDITICVGCGYVMAFDKDLRFRVLTIAEQAAVFSDPHVQRALAVRERVQSQRPDSPAFKNDQGSRH